MAGIHDPMLAVTTSDIRPLPHQIQAVYEQLLPQTPLRFLLADDPALAKRSWPAYMPRSYCCAVTCSGCW